MKAAPSNGVTLLAQPRLVCGPLLRCAKLLWVVMGSHVRAGKGSPGLRLEASSLFFI